MKPAQTHAHPTNNECEPVIGNELEVGDELADGDVYAWGQFWWPTALPGILVRHDDPTFIRPIEAKRST